MRNEIKAENSKTSVDRISYFERDGVRVNRVDYEPHTVQSIHDHEFASVTLVMRGDCHEQSEHDDHISQSCTVLIKPPHAPHANDYGEHKMASLQIAFQPYAFPAFPLGVACTHFNGGAPAASMIALLHATQSLPGEALVSYVSRAMTAVGQALAGRRERGAPGWLEDISTRIAANTDAQISVRALAKDAGLHPVSLARIFRRHHGCSITEFLRRERIVQASRRIATGESSLADVAFETGFADQPHFTRAFRAELGCTPGEFRRLVV